MYWVYKCNSRGHPYQVERGDWADFFADGKPHEWGSTEWVPQLTQARPGDMIVAYQTDRNALVGVAQVLRHRSRGVHTDLILRPVEMIGVRVRPLKRADLSVAAIPALQPGPIRTLYRISQTDARRLLRLARRQVHPDAREVTIEANRAMRGAGFGTPENNRLVEQAAIRLVKSWYARRHWSVADVSQQDRGFDLVCTRRHKRRHVEVKGARGEAQKFILTTNEMRTWAGDEFYQLALVTSAVSRRPSILFFTGPAALRNFSLNPVSYVATPKVR